MNGRVYDALIGSFLSPDNYVQNPGSTQNFNRYGYCLNNPLKYTDPSGMLVCPELPYSNNPAGEAWLANYYSQSFGGGGGGGDSQWVNSSLNYSHVCLENGYETSISNFDNKVNTSSSNGTVTIQTGVLDVYNWWHFKGEKVWHQGSYRNSEPIYSTIVIAQLGDVNMANAGVLSLSDAVSAALSEIGEAALVGITRAAGLLSLLTLQGDTRHIENPVMPGPYTTERGIPWKPNVTEMNNKNYFNDGGPDWVKWIIWGAGGAAAGKTIRDNWPVPSIPPSSTKTNKATEIAPTPFYKWSR
jgi:hypothetical protein